MKKLRKRVCKGYMPPPRDLPPEVSAKLEFLMYAVTAVAAVLGATLLRFVKPTVRKGATTS